MKNIKIEINEVLEPFILIVGAILTAKLIELGACWLLNFFL